MYFYSRSSHIVSVHNSINTVWSVYFALYVYMWRKLPKNSLKRTHKKSRRVGMMKSSFFVWCLVVIVLKMMITHIFIILLGLLLFVFFLALEVIGLQSTRTRAHSFYKLYFLYNKWKCTMVVFVVVEYLT